MTTEIAILLTGLIIVTLILTAVIIHDYFTSGKGK